MDEIWRNLTTGERYVVTVQDDQVRAAAGPLGADMDPRAVLERGPRPPRNLWALLDLRRSPDQYAREYTLNADGSAVAVRGGG